MATVSRLFTSAPAAYPYKSWRFYSLNFFGAYIIILYNFAVGERFGNLFLNIIHFLPQARFIIDAAEIAQMADFGVVGGGMPHLYRKNIHMLAAAGGFGGGKCWRLGRFCRLLPPLAGLYFQWNPIGQIFAV